MFVMLSDKDINKLVKAFATKQEVAEVKSDVKEIKETTHKTFLLVEGLASRLGKQNLENAARDSQLSRHDDWIKHIAKETSVRLEN